MSLLQHPMLSRHIFFQFASFDLESVHRRSEMFNKWC